jgi:type III secretion system FlhB-like substrate exporter
MVHTMGPPVLSICLLMALAASAAGFAQTGFNWAPEAIGFKFDRINPVQRLKDTLSITKFGSRAGLAAAKLTVGGLVIGGIFMADLRPMRALAAASLATSEKFLGSKSLADAGRHHLRAHRDGRRRLHLPAPPVHAAAQDDPRGVHPRPRADRRQAGLQAATAPDAPRALRQPHPAGRAGRRRHRHQPDPPLSCIAYRPGKDKAPRVTARGADDLAMHIRHLARRHGVPIIEQRALARSLWRRCKVGQPVPDALFQEVARILARVYKAKSARTPARPRR